MRNSVITTIAAGALMALAGAAQAALTTSDTFQVSATVTTNCSVDAPDLNLGAYDGSSDLTATSTINVSCTSGTGFKVDLSPGNSGTYANRNLTNGGNSLVYNLYTDLGHTTIWGDGTGGSGTSPVGAGVGTGTPVPFTVYGLLRAVDNTAGVPAQTYTDNITATVTY